MRKVTLILIGAGERGMFAFGKIALENPHLVKFVAVAEPDDAKRKIFAEQHGIPEEMQFSSWEEVFSKPKFADGVVIATPDRLHTEPALAAMDAGYHVLLEKPMAPTMEETAKIVKKSREKSLILQLAHVLRYTPFWSELHRVAVEEKKIGDIVTIQHNENIGYYHFAHSFVRGNWHNSEKSSPIILAKSCHDMDLLYWLTGGKKPAKVSSVGGLYYFRRENKPPGSPERCIEGCPYSEECPFNAVKLYLGNYRGWPQSHLSPSLDRKEIEKALWETDYGRCVFSMDNDVADHQVVQIEFEDGSTASFVLSAFTWRIERTIKLMGTKGEIRGHFEKREIEIRYFEPGAPFSREEKREVIYTARVGGGHGGGDKGTLLTFVRAIAEEDSSFVKTDPLESLMSHALAFAAEESRKNASVVRMDEFLKRFGF